jgi:hypothetical protein
MSDPGAGRRGVGDAAVNVTVLPTSPPTERSGDVRAELGVSTNRGWG